MKREKRKGENYIKSWVSNFHVKARGISITHALRSGFHYFGFFTVLFFGRNIHPWLKNLPINMC